VIGAFVLGALALAAAGVVVFGGTNLFNRPLRSVMYFDESVNGLSVGAQVLYRGVRFGTVTKIRTQVGTNRIAVYADMDRKELTGLGGEKDARHVLETAIERGLRARLGLQSIVTGQLYVSLVILPDAPATRVGFEPNLVEIPTAPTLLQQFVERVEKIMDAVQDLPWADLLRTTFETLEGMRDLSRSGDLQRTIRSAATAMNDLQRLVRQVERDTGPLLASLKSTSDATRTTVTDVGQDLQRTTKELRAALTEAGPLIASLRETSDTARGSVKDVTGDVRQLLADVRPLIGKLEATVESARVTLEKSQEALGSTDSVFALDSPLGFQISQTLRELTAAARSMRALADFFERNPRALIFGRGAPPD
jgi:paraquat-inducible protein B